MERIEKGRLTFRRVFAAGSTMGLDRHLLHAGDEVVRTEFDAVVAVIGRRSREGLWHACKSDPVLAAIQMVRVGDCVVPRLIESVIREAEEIAMSV